MATWTTIPDSSIEPGKPIRSIDGLALRDNPIAISEGAAGAPRIQTAGIQDSAVTTNKIQDSAVTTSKLDSNERINTGNVLNATAGASVGAVGTYAMLSRVAFSGVVMTPGSTYAGSDLRYAGGFTRGNPDTAFGISSTSVAGTWRCMGFANNSFDPEGFIDEFATLFLRIS